MDLFTYWSLAVLNNQYQPHNTYLKEFWHISHGSHVQHRVGEYRHSVKNEENGNPIFQNSFLSLLSPKAVHILGCSHFTLVYQLKTHFVFQTDPRVHCTQGRLGGGAFVLVPRFAEGISKQLQADDPFYKRPAGRDRKHRSMALKRTGWWGRQRVGILLRFKLFFTAPSKSQLEGFKKPHHSLSCRETWRQQNMFSFLPNEFLNKAAIKYCWLNLHKINHLCIKMEEGTKLAPFLHVGLLQEAKGRGACDW